MMPKFNMHGSGWQAIWTFIAILAGVRTLSELFRHGWSDIVLLGLLCVTVSAVFALVAERRRAALGVEARGEALPRHRGAAQRRRAADPILPGRRFF
jgi:hypothetical protein